MVGVGSDLMKFTLLTLDVAVDLRMFISDVSDNCVMMISKLQRQSWKRLVSKFSDPIPGLHTF
jgi:hypothetical protein